MPGEEKDSKQGEQDTPKIMTAEEVAAMVTGANERMKKALSTELKESLKGITDSLPAMFKEHAEALKAEIPKPDDKPADNKPSPEMLALKQQLDALQTGIKERDQKLAEAETRSRNESARNALRAALAPHVRPEALDMTTQVLFDGQKRVTFSETGEPLFKVRRSPGLGMPEEDMDLPVKDGIEGWLKTDEAKIFLPPPGGQHGKTEQPRGNQRGVKLGTNGLPAYETPASSDAEKVRRADERAAALAAKYPNFNDNL